MSDTIRLATIGTSTIGDSLLDAAASVRRISYVGTLSRNADTARAFTERHGGTTPFTSLDELAASDSVDAVYIATPNACHLGQALACMRGGKHVLVEKSLCANAYEAEELFAAADLHGVVAMEAMRPVHDPGWATVVAALRRLGRLCRVSLRYGKYSSRYDDVLAGRHTNIFDTRMASGALMDLGIYCVEPMVAAFGAPDSIQAAALLAGTAGNELTGGAIDVAGSVLCRYGEEGGADAYTHAGTHASAAMDTGMGAGAGAAAGAGTGAGKGAGRDTDMVTSRRGAFIAELAYSKVSQDFLPCQLEGELGTIALDSVNVPQRATLRLRGTATRGAATAALTSSDGSEEELPMTPCSNSMVYELRDFASLVAGDDVDTMWGRLSAGAATTRFRDVTLASLRICDEIRKQTGIVFPADR